MERRQRDAARRPRPVRRDLLPHRRGAALHERDLRRAGPRAPADVHHRRQPAAGRVHAARHEALRRVAEQQEEEEGEDGEEGALMRAWPVALLLALAGCATYFATHQLDERYGKPDPARYDRPPAAVADSALDYRLRAKDILDNRCVVCHGCNDAPCQLNLSTREGVTRGANREQIYATRVLPSAPTRMFFDAQSNAEWRTKGFYPVLNERNATPDADREGSVLYRILRLKRAHPF